MLRGTNYPPTRLRCSLGVGVACRTIGRGNEDGLRPSAWRWPRTHPIRMCAPSFSRWRRNGWTWQNRMSRTIGRRLSVSGQFKRRSAGRFKQITACQGRSRTVSLRFSCNSMMATETETDPVRPPLAGAAPDKKVHVNCGRILSLIHAQGNRVKTSCGNKTCEEFVVPGGNFAFKAEAVLAGSFAD